MFFYLKNGRNVPNRDVSMPKLRRRRKKASARGATEGKERPRQRHVLWRLFLLKNSVNWNLLDLIYLIVLG